VDGIIQQIVTLLDSFDSKQFLTEAGQKHALHRLAEHNVDALVVIGGGESQAGAYALSKRGFPVNGVAASVENDLTGFDTSLGVDTALNIAVETIYHARASTSDYDAFFIEREIDPDLTHLADGLALKVPTPTIEETFAKL
jgi:6-phosphofructokinase 1